MGNARDNVLAGATSVQSVVDELTCLTTRVRHASLEKLPGPDVKVKIGSLELAVSAVLFHVTFVGQAIVEDIRNSARSRQAARAWIRSCECKDNRLPLSPLQFLLMISTDTPQRERPHPRLGRGHGRNAPDWSLKDRPGRQSQTIVNSSQMRSAPSDLS